MESPSGRNMFLQMNMVGFNIQECSGMFRNVQECSGVFRNVQEFSGMFRNVQECSGIEVSILSNWNLFDEINLILE